MFFTNRVHAGKMLAEKLADYADRKDVIILALPRGGVPVAYEVAKQLHLPMDVFLVRKIGVPFHEELAMGAIAMGGVKVFNYDLIRALQIPDAVVKDVVEKETVELIRREALYRRNRSLPMLEDHTVILIDDGIATGSTVSAAIMALRQLHPANIVVAAPVLPSSAIEKLKKQADRLVYAGAPEPFFSVGQWYKDFTQTTDDEVKAIMEQVRQQERVPEEV